MGRVWGRGVGRGLLAGWGNPPSSWGVGRGVGRGCGVARGVGDGAGDGVGLALTAGVGDGEVAAAEFEAPGVVAPSPTAGFGAAAPGAAAVPGCAGCGVVTEVSDDTGGETAVGGARSARTTKKLAIAANSAAPATAQAEARLRRSRRSLKSGRESTTISGSTV